MKRIAHIPTRYVVIAIAAIVLLLIIGGSGTLYYLHEEQTQKNQQEIAQRTRDLAEMEKQLAAVEKSLVDFKSQDQVKINVKNKAEIDNIQKTYKSAMETYEKLLDLGPAHKEYPRLSTELAKTLGMLSERNYASASAKLIAINTAVTAQKQAQIAAFTIPTAVKENNTPPASGYSRQAVKAEIGTYMVDIVSGDLSSTRVIVDTASESDCGNECPVLALGDYVARSGAYAGINGSYFCPASYPSCAGKTNSFDTLLMNKNKKYFNSDNNVYSTVPAVIFGGGWVRFVGRSLEWGRDTGIDSMIANQPMLVSGSKSVFGGDGEVKREGKGSRSFVANRGNVVYIGVVHNASASEMAKVLETMGMENALNLDSGGSTALWAGGYKVGPGRAIPNAILFVRK